MWHGSHAPVCAHERVSQTREGTVTCPSGSAGLPATGPARSPPAASRESVLRGPHGLFRAAWMQVAMAATAFLWSFCGGPEFCGVPASSESLPRGPWTSSSGSRRGERSGLGAAPRRAARSAPVQRGAHAPPDAGLGVRILRRNPSVQQPVPDGPGQGTGSDPGRSGWPAGSSEQREPPAFLAARGPQTPRPLACRGDAGHLVLSPGHPPASGPAGGTGPGSSGGPPGRPGALRPQNEG